MPTDNERREVARRLREYVDLPDDWWQETRAEFYVEKCVFGNVDRHSEAELFTRLADLIEPSDSAQTVAEDMFGQMRHSTEQERVAYADMMARNSVELHPVDRDALLEEAKELEKCARYFGLDFDEDEPLRDRLEEASEDFAGSADRIRKALGGGAVSEFVLTGSDVFGRYCRIEQLRFGVPNELFLYKVVASMRSNCWCEVPYKTASKEVRHDSIEDCVLAICCGIDETEVLRFRVADIEFVPKPTCDRDALLSIAKGLDYAAEVAEDRFYKALMLDVAKNIRSACEVER